jgi:hypothetical protein
MPSLLGYSAFISNALTCTPLPEYQPSIDDSGHIVTCYIESNTNQPFTVVLRDATANFCQGTAVQVDGVYVDNGLTGPGVSVERTWYGKRIDHVSVKPFIFRDNPSGMALVRGRLIQLLRLWGRILVWGLFDCR